MARIVLWLFGLLYVILGIGCIVAPTTASRKVGFELVGGAGRSEFIVVYGGLEIALGIFFLVCGWEPQFQRAGILLALLSSACLALARAATLLFVPDLPRITYTLFTVEVLMTAVAALAFYLDARSSSSGG
jgi:hypothetical protein